MFIQKISRRLAPALIACTWNLPARLPAQTAETPAAVARKALDLLLAEKYTELRAMVALSANQRLTEDFLRNRIGSKLQTFGKLHGVSEPVTAEDAGATIVSFPVHFDSFRLNVQLTLNSSLQLQDVALRPTGDPLPNLWKRPSYSNPEMFTERELTVGTDEWKLGATLTLPMGKGPFPAVVLVHGPGPNDRDESIFSNRIFRDLAEGLSSRGVAVLRYDKRTKVYGEKMSGTDYTIQQESVEDAVRAIALLRTQTEIAANRVFLLGHSIGGYVAPRVATLDSKLAGVIFLGANARPIEDVALDQNDYLAHLNGNPGPQVEQRLDALKAEVAKVKALQSGSAPPAKLIGLPGVYLLDLKGYDPAGQAKQLNIPLLFLQGGRDFQVTAKDFGLWKAGLAGRNNAIFKEYPALNGLFIAGEGKPGPGEYVNPGNVDATVISDIAAWIAQRASA